MTKEEILTLNGWVVECQSPYEISHSDGSFASGQAAHMVASYLEEEFISSGKTDHERLDYLFNPEDLRAYKFLEQHFAELHRSQMPTVSERIENNEGFL